MIDESKNVVIENNNIDFRDTNNESIRKKLEELDRYKFPKLGIMAMQSTKDAFEDVMKHCSEQTEFIHFLVSKIACSGSAQFQTWAGTQNSNFQKVYSDLMETQRLLFLADQKVDYYEHGFVKDWESKVNALEIELSSVRGQLGEEKESAKSQIDYWKEQSAEVGKLEKRIDELSAENDKLFRTAEYNYNAGRKVWKQLQELKSQSDMQAREELNRVARQLQMTESELEEAKHVIDQKDEEIEKLKLEIEELKKKEEPQSREPSVIPVNFKTPIDNALIRDVKAADASGISKNQIAKQFHIGKDKVTAILSMPEGVVAMG